MHRLRTENVVIIIVELSFSKANSQCFIINLLLEQFAEETTFLRRFSFSTSSRSTFWGSDGWSWRFGGAASWLFFRFLFFFLTGRGQIRTLNESIRATGTDSVHDIPDAELLVVPRIQILFACD